ncbi:rna-directed dna polymerase from mobile element jockey-like [Limosa lapponica baueri]|uniref:Rna-directed dna polymerase from mobile element jockey-like n=1 Tax=Limosa lapponica baueri TaxID=1758121 RepID=A0A2I0TYP6_LIMLA|nr:rna-directed dna polymerase from mobile element jockey-like [Limosa lapponica baueri]
MGSKQEESETCARLQGYDLTGITETWWDGSYDWSVRMEGYRLFRKDRLGRWGGGVALYVNDQLECVELLLGMDEDLTESLWVRIKGSTGAAGYKKSRKFLECVDENFLLQMIEEPMRKGAVLDLVLTNKEGLVGNVKFKSSLGSSDHEMVEFKIHRAARRVCSKLATLDFGRADFGLLRDLIGRVAWEKELEGRGAQESWLVFKGHLIQAQERCIPKKKSGKIASRPVRMNKELLDKPRTIKGGL